MTVTRPLNRCRSLDQNHLFFNCNDNLSVSTIGRLFLTRTSNGKNVRDFRLNRHTTGQSIPNSARWKSLFRARKHIGYFLFSDEPRYQRCTMNPDDAEHQEATTSAKVAVSRSVDSGRYCWVCFATDEDDENAAWVQPCNCRGTTKWVCGVHIKASSIFRWTLFSSYFQNQKSMRWHSKERIAFVF